MKKYFFYTLGFVLFVSISAAAQPTDATNISRADAGFRRFKPINPLTDKTDQVDITGMGAATFTTSNKADGTTNSYKHAQKISITLIPAGGKAGSYQLIFYPESEEVPYAAVYNEGTLNIYYPINLFTTIRATLEQAFAAKKKVSVKVIQKADGYREGKLVF